MQFLLGQLSEHCPIWDWCIWATNQTSNVSFALNHNVMKFGKKTRNTQKLGNVQWEYPSTTNCNLKHELHAMSILII
jgi:hypothetical protein